MDVADLAARDHADELELVRERLRGLDVVVTDDATGLEVPGVVHELEVVVPDVLEVERIEPFPELPAAWLVGETLHGDVVEEAAEFDPVVAERRQDLRHL